MPLVVIRHGTAEGNRHHRFIGWSPVRLDPDGRRQAEAVADRLEAAGVERVVSSDLIRAVETAGPLAKRLGVDVETDPRLREVNNGEWTGLLPTEIAERWPDLWDGYINGEDVARPDGEQWADVRHRVRDALTELASAETLTAVFTHGGPVMLSAEWALGVSLPGNIFRGPLAAPGNASITTIEPGPRLLGYADVGHLSPLARYEVPYDPVD